MTPTKIVLDIDGVLADFNRAYAKALLRVSGFDLLPKGWHKDGYTAFTTWYWERQYGYGKEIETATWNGEILPGAKKFWAKLSPLPYARETLLNLDALARGGAIELYFLTNRFGERVKAQTEEFLYQNGVTYPTVLLAKDKMPLLKDLGAQVFVDDKIETMNGCAADPDLAKIQLYLPDAPWNLEGRVEGYTVVPNVKEAIIHAGLWREPKESSVNKGRRALLKGDFTEVTTV
jgi:hypothetical protein